jgi:hypothetical protein
MKSKGVKIQITLSKEMADLIEKELEKTHMTKSSLFSKILTEYFNIKTGGIKKIIELDINR